MPSRLSPYLTHLTAPARAMADMGSTSVMRPNVQQLSMPEDMLEVDTSKEVQAVTSFDQMGMKDDLLRSIYNYGFEKPSAIQQRALVPILIGLISPYLLGFAINFVNSDEIKILRDIEQYYSTQIDELPMNVSDLI